MTIKHAQVTPEELNEALATPGGLNKLLDSKVTCPVCGAATSRMAHDPSRIATHFSPSHAGHECSASGTFIAYGERS
jgi:hypothetical protein